VASLNGIDTYGNRTDRSPPGSYSLSLRPLRRAEAPFFGDINKNRPTLKRRADGRL